MRARTRGGTRLFQAAVILVLLAPGCSGDPPPAGLDLIVVSVDTLRADRMALYGAARDTDGDPGEPWSIGWLARRATVWDTCWAPSGKTVPSLGSFWTGRHPLEHGAVSNYHVVQSPSRAAALAELGWRGHAAVANRAVAQPLGFRRGFQSFGLFAKEREPALAPALAARAEPEIRAGNKLLLWAHFMAPHQPYAPPTEAAARYTSASGPPGTNEVLYALHRAPKTLTESGREHLRALYDAEVATAAGYVQDLLSRLDGHYRAAGRGGLLENAVVVFFSDHGEELGDRHGYFLHAKSLYSGVIRVPLLVAGPGYGAVREPAPIGLHEVLGRVADRLGAEAGAAPHDWPQQAGPRGPFCASWHREFYAVRDARWTLVHNPCRSAQGPREPPTDAAYPYPEVALYDRSADPLEERDVSGAHPDEVRRLLRELRGWYDGLRIAVPRLPDEVDPSQAPDLSELGYTEAAPEDEPCPILDPAAWSPQ